VTLVNTNPIEPRTVVVQGGGYGEHRFDSVTVAGKTSAVSSPVVTVRLEAGAGRFPGRANGLGQRQAVADLADGLDRERGAAVRFGEAADASDRPVDGVVADRPSAPARSDQFVARDDRAAGAGQRDQHLHDPGFERFRAFRSDHQTARRIDGESPQREGRRAGQNDRNVCRRRVHRHLTGLPASSAAFHRLGVLSHRLSRRSNALTGPRSPRQAKSRRTRR
jgi:hypothetical protein